MAAPRRSSGSYGAYRTGQKHTTDAKLFGNASDSDEEKNKDSDEEVREDNDSLSNDSMLEWMQEIAEKDAKKYALREAIKSNSVETVKNLLAENEWIAEEIIYSQKTPLGYSQKTPLEYAEKYGHQGIIDEIKKFLSENK